jgi:hypothetical protein
VPIFDSGSCCLGLELAPGRYRSPYVWAVGITVDVPAGWRFFREDRRAGGVVALVRGEGNAIAHAVEYVALFPIQPSEPIDAFETDLRATSHLVVEAIEDLVVAGDPAVAIDATAEANPAQTGTDEIVAGAISFPTIDRIYSPYKWRSETPEARFRFIVVDHGGGGGLLVYLEAPPDAFDQLAADATPIIESIAFID